jgi:hypothetical protein
VALTDIHDAWVPNALAGLEVGQLVKAAVLPAAEAAEAAGGKEGKEGQRPQLQLSLRQSRGGAVHGLKRPAAKGALHCRCALALCSTAVF